ncbi:hypothetical protein L0F63_001010 [Massospora cicadina]|nr:hypothetical protein L0F63_001010 [Massospora cicadina]
MVQSNCDVTLLGELPTASPFGSEPSPTVTGEPDSGEVGFQLDPPTPDLIPVPFVSESSTDYLTGSHRIGATRDVFRDQEKFAYVGLCKLLLVELANVYPFKHPEFANANASYTQFGRRVMRKLYTHMAVTEDEQVMVERMPGHGVVPKDLTTTILLTCGPRTAKFAAGTPIQLGRGNAAPDVTGTVAVDIRWTIVLDLFLLLTSEDVYDARSRTLLRAVAEQLELGWLDVVRMEKEISEQFQINDVADTLTHNAEISGRKRSNLKRRLALMGVATVGGGFIIGLSAGLLAPLIASGLGAAFGGLGLAGSTAFLGSTGGAALITTGGVVTGGTIAGQRMEKRTRGVDIFQFYPVSDHRRASVLISITGWLPGKGEDVTKPFGVVDPLYGDHFSLLWEPEALKQLGNSLKLLAGEVLSFAAQEILKHTLLSALMAAISLPMALAKLGYLVDNPWSNGLSLAEKAGRVLADVLLNHAQGYRPVSLVGFSLGARVIFYCLQELARVKAYGIVENVYLFGAPVTASRVQWRECASVVSGRFVNGHVKSDWILGFLYRAASTTLTIAGLHPVVGVAGVENMDVTHLVSGHLAYRHLMPTLMKACGIPVVSETFEDEDESEATELEVSDHLEAVMSGQASSGAQPVASGSSGERPRSWYTTAFDRLKGSGRARASDANLKTYPSPPKSLPTPRVRPDQAGCGSGRTDPSQVSAPTSPTHREFGSSVGLAPPSQARTRLAQPHCVPTGPLGAADTFRTARYRPGATGYVPHPTRAWGNFPHPLSCLEGALSSFTVASAPVPDAARFDPSKRA